MNEKTSFMYHVAEEHQKEEIQRLCLAYRCKYVAEPKFVIKSVYCQQEQEKKLSPSKLTDFSCSRIKSTNCWLDMQSLKIETKTRLLICRKPKPTM